MPPFDDFQLHLLYRITPSLIHHYHANPTNNFTKQRINIYTAFIIL